MHMCTLLQVLVSTVFVLEVVGLFVFHLVPVLQLGLFLKNRYFWFLAVIAVGGLAGAIWWVMNPSDAGNFMAIFQVGGCGSVGWVGWSEGTGKISFSFSCCSCLVKL